MKLIYNIIKLILLVFFLLLALFNTHSVEFKYLPAQGVSWPLIAILFIAFLIGTLFGILAMFGRILRLRNENSRLRHEAEKAARTAAAAVPSETAARQ